MGIFSQTDDDSYAQAHNRVVNAPHEASLSHELIAGAASYEAAKAYERHVAQNGQPASHAEAKEILAGFIGAFIDREAETRGLNMFDKERAKHEAHRQLEPQLNEYY